MNVESTRRVCGVIRLALVSCLLGSEVVSYRSSACAADELDGARERRCGQLVTLTALQFYGITFGLDTIDRELSIGERGVNLLRIQRLLTAHGLKVSARKGLTTEAFSEFVTGTRIAIFTMDPENWTRK